jgi:hypothetical protein
VRYTCCGGKTFFSLEEPGFLTQKFLQQFLQHFRQGKLGKVTKLHSKTLELIPNNNNVCAIGYTEKNFKLPLLVILDFPYGKLVKTMMFNIYH